MTSSPDWPEEIDDRDWDDYDTCWCGWDLSGQESHYHCANCGGIASMMGHWDEPDGFTCTRKPREAW